ncbi:RING-type E3 ubiquitin transferase [Trifolium repens]|nr:RING/U-box superfamily protein [Trifolium repens]WJX82900.1 RING-type E3 ubiquitin transferase [Trifolium repens]
MSSPHSYFTNLGLGYSIAITLAFLVLLATLILSFYLCCRNNHNPNNNPNNNNSLNYTDGGIVLRLDTFIAENDEENQLGEENTVMGLEDNVINSYPRFQFSRDSATVLGQNTTCSICLCEYKDSEMLRMMPECRHYFHLCCLDSWLKLNGSCPVCRNSPLPTPLSTPLQEVVPLSQYGDDRRRRR